MNCGMNQVLVSPIKYYKKDPAVGGVFFLSVSFPNNINN
jgi:hypothetical protein